MLVAVHLSSWQGRRLDRKLSEEAEERHSTAPGAVKTHKYLVPHEALAPVEKLHGALRLRHYKHTLPWGESNVRIISSASYIDPYVPEMTTLRDECLKAHKAFIAKYPELKAEAPKRLNGLYREKDFPSEVVIASKFGVSIDLLPVPETDDFRVLDLGAAQEAAEQSVHDTILRRNREAQADVYERILEPLKHFVETMRKSGKGKRYPASVVENLIEAARAMPRLSLVPDPDLEAECAAIIKELAFDPKTLSKQASIRKEAAQKAEVRIALVNKAFKAMQGAFA
jgi:hypothetical protein